MGLIFYTAIVERGRDGFGVTFPDLPGCTSWGASLQEAARNAEDALAGHIEVSIEHGDAVPDPSELDAIVADPDVDEAARILVRAYRPGKSVRINISIDDGLLEQIDRVSGNRSGFFAGAARNALAAMRAA